MSTIQHKAAQDGIQARVNASVLTKLEEINMNYNDAKYQLGKFKCAITSMGRFKLKKNGDIVFHPPGKGAIIIKKPK